jgi:cytochrome c553
MLRGDATHSAAVGPEHEHAFNSPPGHRFRPRTLVGLWLRHNPRSGFIAYVPTGSIRKGEDLVTTGGPALQGNSQAGRRTTLCSTCHGPDLMGLADIPPIAGRSPSYLVRQLWDIQQGTRHGEVAQVMKPVVANLTGEDLVAIAAYGSSRPGR